MLLHKGTDNVWLTLLLLIYGSHGQKDTWQDVEHSFDFAFWNKPASNTGTHHVTKEVHHGADHVLKTVVPTSHGWLKGKVISTSPSNTVTVFLGVPYAEPPKRFEKPIDKKHWNGTKSAKHFKPKCPRMIPDENSNSWKTDGNEDCLYLNIFKPDLNQTEHYPVLFWPQEANPFTAGTNHLESISILGNRLIKHGVIVVQPHYRTGPFGFWSTETEEAAGNYGIQDLLMALKWVKKEIVNFGGNPKRIILQGQGVDGAIVDALSLSPKSKDLFHGMILQSASAFSPLMAQSPTLRQHRARNLANSVGCSPYLWDAGAYNELIECMRGKSMKDILEASDQLIERINPTRDYLWQPRQDEEMGKESLFPDDYEALASKRPNVPVIIGTNDHETVWNLIVEPYLFRDESSEALISSLNKVEAIDRQCSIDIRSLQDYFANVDAVQEACRHEASSATTGNDDADSYETFNAVIDIGSSLFYHAPMAHEIASYLKNGNKHVYAYSFDYVRSQNGWWRRMGSFHNLDMLYLQGTGESYFNDKEETQLTLTVGDTALRNTLAEMWANFAIYLDPTPARQLSSSTTHVIWNPVKSDAVEYLSISQNPEMKTAFHLHSVHFWNRVMPSIEKLFGKLAPENSLIRNDAPIDETNHLERPLSERHSPFDKNRSRRPQRVWVIRPEIHRRQPMARLLPFVFRQ